jgi:hypothetical protein
MSKNIRSIFSRMGHRLFVDENIKEMKDNVERLMKKEGSEDIEDNVHTSKVLCDNGVIADEYLVYDATHIHNSDVYDDVEFFTSMSSKTKTVFDSVHNCATSGGRAFSKRVYGKSVCDIALLEQRTKCLEWMERTYTDNKERVDTLLEILTKNEKHVAWLFEEKEESVKDLYSMVFFRLKGLLPLNNVGSALTTYNLYRIIISPLFGIIAPIFYFLIPYLIVLYKFKVYIPFTTYIKTMFFAVFHSSDTLFGTHKIFKYLRIVSYMFSAAFYFQGIFTSVDIAKTVNKMSKLIITSFNSVIEYIEASNELLNMFWSDDHMSCYVDTTKACPNSKEAQDQYIATINKCKKDYNLCGNFGEQLKIYKNNNVSVMKQMVRKACIIDALLGAVRLKVDRSYTYTQFVKTSERPKVQLMGMVHPCITRDKAVTNDIELGCDKALNVNAIITSPNSSGKSILIKSMIVNVLMSQSMGISCCKNATITPFTFINTQINVPDSTGLESLFEAEMHRCKFTLDKLKELKDDNRGFTLTVMDEIFNSTNPIEAVAGGYAVCKKMASFTTNMLIFTTHFNYLTKLAKENDCHFGNYRMETIVDSKTNDITFTYKLQKGVNKHMLALELLKKSGFDDEILDDAIAIKKQLLTKNKA